MRSAALVTLAIVSLALTSGLGCAAYTPQGMWEATQTVVSIESKNFVVRKLGAQGTAQRSYLFGVPVGSHVSGIAFGSFDVQARAWRDLHKNWDGEGSVVFHNINVEWTSYGIPLLFIVHQNTITADIYEFNDEYVDYATRGERGR